MPLFNFCFKVSRFELCRAKPYSSHLGCDELFYEGEAAAGGGVVAVDHPPRAEGAEEGRVRPDDVLADVLGELLPAPGPALLAPGLLPGRQGVKLPVSGPPTGRHPVSEDRGLPHFYTTLH